MTTIQVYLNTGRDWHDYDYSPPSVRLALKFELSDTITHQLIQGLPIATLERVFGQLNAAYHDRDDAPTSWANQFRRNVNRSLSVGDVVVVGETAYAVTKSGWLRITTDQLLDAILSNRNAMVD
jgi:hypothetical protein